MKTIFRILIITVTLALLIACSDAARGLYDSAQFEEKQGNLPHAIQLYEEIVNKYPASDITPDAKKRIEKLKGSTQ